MSDVAFIPVRGGSTSIPLKNIKPLCGKPLVYWTAAAAAASEHIDTVYVATDSEVIRTTVEGFGIEKVLVIGRSDETATATASSESALLEFAENHMFDFVALIQATSPLLTTDDVDKAFEMVKTGDYDSVLSVVEDKHFYWRDTTEGAIEVNYNVYARTRRQDFKGWGQENGAIYVTDRAHLLESKNRVSGRIGLLVMAPESGFEIDEPSDWEIVEALFTCRESRSKNPPVTKHNDIRLFLTDCDGCLTDGGMYYGEDGSEYKKFNTRDGMAFQLLREFGIRTGIITGEDSKAAECRSIKLGCEFLELACKDKLNALKRLCASTGLGLRHVVYVGDDINDLPCMMAIRDAGGVVACPANAAQEVIAVSDYVAICGGGYGAVREIADWVIGLVKLGR